MKLDTGGRFLAQKNSIRHKGLALATSLKTLSSKLTGPSILPLVEAVRAKLLPTITYGSEAQKGRDAKILHATVTAYRVIFGLPKYTSPAQIRLEFGVQKQTFARQGTFITAWDRMRKAHGWMTLNTYTEPGAQAYFNLGYEKNIKIAFMKYRFGLLPCIQHTPPWLRNKAGSMCRLRGLASEDLLHLLCSCKELLKERKKLLKPLFNQRGIRTRRQALLACFAPSDPQLNCRAVKYLRLCGSKMPEIQTTGT